jgi:hypothetical protein
MHSLRSKLMPSRGTLHIQHRLLLSGQAQLFNSHRASRAINSLHKYPHVSRKFFSTDTINTEKTTASSSKFGRIIVIASSLCIGAATILANLNHKYAEAENNEQEVNKKYPKALKRGGPKNLQIADHLIDEIDAGVFDNKPRLVILGSGWGVSDSVS